MIQTKEKPKEKEQKIPGKTELLIEANPDIYREYLRLESFFCDAHTMEYIHPKQVDAAFNRLEALFTFFMFDSSRQKFNTLFWGGKAK